jgi:hypothetical protein
MAPVGIKNIATIEKQMAGGYQAQGWALAQTIIAQTVNAAQQLQRAAMGAFELSNQARDETVRALNDWKKNLNDAAKSNGNLHAAGVSEKSAGRIARSASTRTSEFTSIVKAMNNGFTRETLREKTGVADVENVGFHTIVELARLFNQTGANGGRGRPADPFAVKLAKWLEAQKPEGDDAEVKAKVVNALANILPHDEGIPDDVVLHRRADDPVVA